MSSLKQAQDNILNTTDERAHKSAKVSGLASKSFLQGPGVYAATEILGFEVLAEGTGDWTYVFLNDTSTRPGVLNTLFPGSVKPYHLKSITVAAGGQALLLIPK